MFLLPKNYLEVKLTTEKGYGVFARKKISAGTVISDYLGKMINIAEYNLENDKKGLYLMYYSDQISIYPNLSKPGPHLLNHSCCPNCWIYIYKGHTLFIAIKDIFIHDELTISYLLSPDEGTCTPCTHICKCESKNCTGTMHLTKNKYEKWQLFLEGKKNTNKTSKSFGNNLHPLLSYPKKLPIHSIYVEMQS
jgi:SET domain-containing protein